MSQYTDTYSMGATLMNIGTGITQVVQIVPAAGTNGGFFKLAVGSGGTLSIVSGAGVSANAGYILGATEVVSFEGPALFWLAAMGATATVAYVPSYNYNRGLTQQP